MGFIPYSCQTIDERDIAAVTAVLRSPYLTQGPELPAFESEFALLHEVAHAIAVTNATAALHLALLAMDVGPGSRVWTSPNSFVASANAALYCGAAIDFVDIDPATRNMSLAALAAKLECAADGDTLPDVLIPVDFAGQPCDLREMRALADRYHFRILEDASHATGARYLGRPVGSAWVHASVFSFHAVKVVTTAEGGMVTTPDAALADRVRQLRNHGVVRDPARLQQAPEGAWVYEQQTLGFNCRMTELQAALGRSQLGRLPELHARRVALADRYDTLLRELPLRLPARAPNRQSAWHLYAVEVDRTRCRTSRAELFAALRDSGIGANVHYIPIHTQPYYRALGFEPGDFPAAENYYAGAISLPLFPAMSESQQDRVVAVLRRTLGVRRGVAAGATA